METTNKIIAMFDIEKCKKMIAECPFDEVAILYPQWGVSRPEYTDSEIEQDADHSDFEELETALGHALTISDSGDLIADPHGINF